MQVLTTQEMQEVHGATENDANSFAFGVFTGGLAGFMVGGPVGAVAGAISVGVHAALISHYW